MEHPFGKIFSFLLATMLVAGMGFFASCDSDSGGGDETTSANEDGTNEDGTNEDGTNAVTTTTAITTITDTAPPIPGNSGAITTISVTHNSLTLKWTEGNDNYTGSTALKYAVYQSSNNDISTVDTCESKGTLIQSYTANLTTKIVSSGLSAGTHYYFNVVVKDSAEKKTVYTMKVQGTALTTNSDWTVMVYMCGDNDLEAAAMVDINEMEVPDLAGESINIIALIDRGPGYDTTDGDWKNTRLYKISYDSGGLNASVVSTRLSSPELGLTTTGNEELNMGSYSNVSSLIDFCKVKYTANKYAFIFWDHGSGWRSKSITSKPKLNIHDSKSTIIDNISYNKEINDSIGTYKAVCFDSSSSDDSLHTQEIRLGLTGKGINIVGFDACLAGMVEVAYEIKDSASYMIGSEDLEPGDGWEYDVWLDTFMRSSKTEMNLINAVVDAYSTKFASEQNTTLSAIDLTKIGALFTSLNTFSTKLYTACSTKAIRDEVRDVLFDYAEDYYDSSSAAGDLNIDIWDMADQIYTRTNYADTEATALKSAVESAVVDEWHHSTGNPRSHGIAIHYTALELGNPVGHLSA